MKAINPRVMLKEKDGRGRLFSALSAAGYVPQEDPFNAMFNAISRCTPIMFEGYRGGGKTAFAEALSKGLDLPIFTLPCLSDTTTDHILFQWNSSAQDHFISQEQRRGVSLDDAMESQWGLKFLKLGEVLEAFHYSLTHEIPAVLLIDEIDKLSMDAESALLQILARGYANVPQLRPDPRVGFVPEVDPEFRRLNYPIIVLTSNNMGSGVSSPLRSRARFAVIKAPSIVEMVRILAAKVPGASSPLLYQAARLVKGISGLPLKEKPALREYIEMLETFVFYGYKNITAEIIRQNIDCLAKTETDVEAMLDATAALYEMYVANDDPEIEAIVREITEQRRSAVGG